MDLPEGPTGVIWDITYACPLRCFHCYSESGRRPSRQLSRPDLLRVADGLASLRPYLVTFAGGEPLLVDGLVEVAERISRAGVQVGIYTGGWRLDPALAEELGRVFDHITVSVDGASAQTHDRIRGRAGSFERALRAATLLDETARRQRADGSPGFRFGLDCVVTRSNRHEMERFCTSVASRFEQLDAVSFGAAVPSGLASRPEFAEHELLTDEQLAEFGDGRLVERLRQLAPPSVEVTVTDNLELRMDPELLAANPDFRPLQVEPDGQVRAMPIYEGTVGSLLDEPAMVLWQRAVHRWSDEFVVRTLAPVRSVRQWAAATRALDHHFGTAAVRARMARRPVFVPDPVLPVSA
ncbi:hypothetical protein GCM10027280_19490 [Micromonospora polyrhachis]|uniref:MoaA/NifB/PqqE/SkfB family radical SAM enzyme n=1 Tax=Micromonospora polyrhachis TaxID=1282883 RepID=A0A7W7SLL2_9ACTN|nr:radical SAM protein [Micromonospora polyrhachis]MBB4957043.1 MoaA/NifB/PqqE/SkfB family radical SAM enzyme [Micromonospora polyrhachis]